MMQWLGFEATFQLLDEPLLCYKAVPTRHLQSISLFSSFNDFTRWSPSVPQKMPNFSGQCAFLYLLHLSCILFWYCHSRHEVCSVCTWFVYFFCLLLFHLLLFCLLLFCLLLFHLLLLLHVSIYMSVTVSNFMLLGSVVQKKWIS